MNNAYPLINPKLHLWIWTVFITFEIISIGMDYGQFGHPLAYIQNYALHISFFYLHALMVMPCWRIGKLYGYLRFIVLIFSEYSIYLCLNYQLNYGFLSFPHAMNEIKLDFDFRYLLGRSWRLSFFLGLATGYYFLVKYLQEHKENLVLEREAMANALREKDAEMAVANATNAALKAQINPHFLFNVLNFMYNRNSKSDAELGQATLLLSKMMRYAIKSELDSGKICLKSEMAEVWNLIGLWKLIKKDRFYVEIDLDDEAGQIRFIPLVLLTLSENIFKHGDLSNPDQPAYFSLKVENGYLLIETSNLVHAMDGNQAQRATGLENIRRRLIYEYGDRVVFDYSLVEENRFQVRIEIEMAVLT